MHGGVARVLGSYAEALSFEGTTAGGIRSAICLVRFRPGLSPPHT